MKNRTLIEIRFFRNIVLLAVLIFLPGILRAQACNTDSNFYSVSYSDTHNPFVKNAIRTSQNEMVALCQNELSATFISKFTQQGNVLWSNEYLPDYPHTTWLQYPWYSSTKWTGMAPANDSSFYVYGSATEHGALQNNEEVPAKHSVGLMMNLDKFGNVLSGKYFGNWGTDYTVEKILQLNGGNLIVFLRSHLDPFISKIICIGKNGDIIWGTPLKLFKLYTEEVSVSPQITEMDNGNVAVVCQVMRTVADTLNYPFLTITIPPPLRFFNFLIIDGKSGNLISHTSFEGPALTGSNVSNQYVMEAKSLTQLPNGDFSMCADMYFPIDSVIFYRQKVFSKRAVNFIADKFGFFKRLVAYSINGNGACSLEGVSQKGNGEQTLLIKDSSNQQLSLVAIDIHGDIKWTKTYANKYGTSSSAGIVLNKANSNGYSIFQSDINGAAIFNLTITNTAGNSACETREPVKMLATETVWPWPSDKVVYMPASIDIDFRYSSFNLIKTSHPLQENTYCKYQFECCRSVIDSVHEHSISLCTNQTYTLPDSTIIRDAGKYYVTLKKQDGCDSIVFYNAQLLKSPKDMKVTSDTCLNGSASLLLHASGGYNNYLWNNHSTIDSSYEIHSAGNYPVTVNNACGSFTDTVHVFDLCDYPVYFPNAFTPNLDNLNDILRLPNTNKNKLIRLRVYNQFGQLLFSGSQVNEGWDGRYKGEPQPTGLYVYILEMRGLTGNKITQKGTVTLLR